jgi:hypothetical protein
MTEAEWLASRDPETMLRFVGRYTSRRKERLFAVACCRRLGELLSDYCLELLTRIESAADRPLSVAAFKELINDAMAHADGLSYQMGTPIGSAWWLAGNAIWSAAEGNGLGVVDQVADAVTTAKRDPDTYDVRAPRQSTVGDPAEFATQADLLRHIVGNPFRPVIFSPQWRTSTAVTLAAQMYESRDFSAAPILADALQDAGCGSDDILDHCRGEGPHVRGCWVVDLVLGKE